MAIIPGKKKSAPTISDAPEPGDAIRLQYPRLGRKTVRWEHHEPPKYTLQDLVKPFKSENIIKMLGDCAQKPEPERPEFLVKYLRQFLLNYQTVFEQVFAHVTNGEKAVLMVPALESINMLNNAIIRLIYGSSEACAQVFDAFNRVYDNQIFSAGIHAIDSKLMPLATSIKYESMGGERPPQEDPIAKEDGKQGKETDKVVPPRVIFTFEKGELTSLSIDNKPQSPSGEFNAGKALLLALWKAPEHKLKKADYDKRNGDAYRRKGKLQLQNKIGMTIFDSIFLDGGRTDKFVSLSNLISVNIL